jgi:hypothetical protein
MKSLLRDGGMLGIIGLARSTTLRDYPMDLAGVVAARWHARLKTYWEPPSPQVWPPPETYSQVRAVADRVLPGARYRRHAMFRYTLIWTKAA